MQFLVTIDVEPKDHVFVAALEDTEDTTLKEALVEMMQAAIRRGSHEFLDKLYRDITWARGVPMVKLDVAAEPQ